MWGLIHFINLSLLNLNIVFLHDPMSLLDSVAKSLDVKCPLNKVVGRRSAQKGLGEFGGY